MAYTIKSNRKEYSSYYGNFRGVDFSSDHTAVDATRFSYLVNMYKDYRNGQGNGVETFPGWRNVLSAPAGSSVTDLIPISVEGYDGKAFLVCLDYESYREIRIAVESGEAFSLIDYGSEYGHKEKAYLDTGKRLLHFEYDGKHYLFAKIKKESGQDYVLQQSMAYVAYGGGNFKFQEATVYTPTTYKSIASDEVGNPVDKIEYEQKNMASPRVINTFIGDGSTTEFELYDAALSVESVVVDGTNYEQVVDVLALDTGKFFFDASNNKIKFSSAPADSEGEDTIVVTLSRVGYVNLRSVDLNVYDFIEEGSDTSIYSVSFPYGYPDSLDIRVTYYNVESGVTDTIPEYDSNADPGQNLYYTVSSGQMKLSYVSLSPFAGDIRVHVYAYDDTDNFDRKISDCTISCAYDNRIFLSGNPDYPNMIFWCGIPAEGAKKGVIDPTYWGELNYVQDGFGNVPVVGMFPVADTLCVLKKDSRQEPCVYYHTKAETGEDLVPVTYPHTAGLSGIGCVALDGCANFRDDPVFISSIGLSAIGQLSVRLERATEHRSTNIDAKLLQTDLTKCQLEVWDGYLILLTNDGQAFLADSRSVYKGKSGQAEYEWYYLDGVGSYSGAGEHEVYRYAKVMPAMVAELQSKMASGDTVVYDGDETAIAHMSIAKSVYDGLTYKDLTGQTAEGTTENFSYNGFTFYYTEETDGNGKTHYFLLEESFGEWTGGDFHPALFIRADKTDLYFGTKDGLYKFNFDLREPDGTFNSVKKIVESAREATAGESDEDPHYTEGRGQYTRTDKVTVDGVSKRQDTRSIMIYSRDGHAYVSGCATKMDNCGIPHLVKNTVKKSLVVKTRSSTRSTAKIKVRTNRNAYEQIARLSDENVDFDLLEFADMTFTDTPQSLFAVSEKEKKWVEKQYYFFSDEHNKSFCIYYVSYRYYVSGKYKNT